MNIEVEEIDQAPTKIFNYDPRQIRTLTFESNFCTKGENGGGGSLEATFGGEDGGKSGRPDLEGRATSVTTRSGVITRKTRGDR